MEPPRNIFRSCKVNKALGPQNAGVIGKERDAFRDWFSFVQAPFPLPSVSQPEPDPLQTYQRHGPQPTHTWLHLFQTSLLRSQNGSVPHFLQPFDGTSPSQCGLSCKPYLNVKMLSPTLHPSYLHLTQFKAFVTF